MQELERQVEYVVDDCFFTVGQVVGMRTTVDYDAVIWWRDHYRAKFLAAMMAFGNRWLQDRSNVTSVAFMLAERAVRYAEGKPSIDARSGQTGGGRRRAPLRAARTPGRAPAGTRSLRRLGHAHRWLLVHVLIRQEP